MRVNLDLENERRKTTLNPECITEKIFGKKEMQIRRLACKYILISLSTRKNNMYGLFAVLLCV